MYEIFTNNAGAEMIRRLSFPRFEGLITIGGAISDVSEIKWIDRPGTDVMAIARVMRETGDYLSKHYVK